MTFIMVLMTFVCSYAGAQQVALVRPATTQLDEQFIAAASKNDTNKLTALLQAHASGKANARININAQDAKGGTALASAAYAGHVESIRILLQVQADPDIPTEKGKTALMYAAQAGIIGGVEMLLEADADLDAQDMYGKTALMYAAKGGYTAVARRLIGAGAGLDIQDRNGQTALMHAAWYKKTDTVTCLRTAGADETLVDTHGRTFASIQREKAHDVWAGIDIRPGRLEGYTYTRHVIEQMRNRVVSLRDVRFILAHGKSYADKKGSGVLKIAHTDKNIGIIMNPNTKSIITVISFIDVDERNDWLTKERDNDIIAWLEKNRSSTPSSTSTVQHREESTSRGDDTDQEDEELDGYIAELEEEDEKTNDAIKQNKLERFINSLD